MQSLSGLESPHTYCKRKLKIFNSRISLHGFSTQSRHMAPDHINENHRELQIAFSRVDRHSVTIHSFSVQFDVTQWNQSGHSNRRATSLRWSPFFRMWRARIRQMAIFRPSIENAMNLELNPFVAARSRFGKNEQQAIFDQRCQGASLICRRLLALFRRSSFILTLVLMHRRLILLIPHCVKRPIWSRRSSRPPPGDHFRLPQLVW